MRDDPFAQREADQAPYLEKFNKWSRYLGLANYGIGVTAFDRIREAWWDIREWRRVSNTRGGDYEKEIAAVRIAAEVFASQIEAAATATQDVPTIAWVAAGLRCPAQPFCTGCTSCQTVTSPLRPNTSVRRGMW